MSFLAESIVGAVTAVTLGGLWFANRILAREEGESSDMPTLTREQWTRVYNESSDWVSRRSIGSAAQSQARRRRDEAARALMDLDRKGE